MYIALTRAVPPTIVRCQLTHIQRAPIDVGVAIEQHDRYEQTLRALGCRIERLPEEPDMPDSVFVEDTAVVFDEIAVITRPGAESRRAETETVASVLAAFRPLRYIEPPGTMDGGDVLQVGRHVFVGLSGRTNEPAVAQLATALTPFGYTVAGVNLSGCLHLKSAVTALADDCLLLNRAVVDGHEFDPLRQMQIDPHEPWAANVLRVGRTIICAESALRTARRLEHAGFQVVSTPMTELAKAEGGLTCCSLVFKC